jgi:hypothetical protein
MLLGDGGSLLNCWRNARWMETTDSCFTNCSTKCFLLQSHHYRFFMLETERGEGVGLHIRTNLNTCFFVPCGKLINACIFKAVMVDWNRSNGIDTCGILNRANFVQHTYRTHFNVAPTRSRLLGNWTTILLGVLGRCDIFAQ